MLVYLKKEISIKIIFCWHLEGHRRKEQDPDPHPDQLVKCTDPRFWIWICTKIPQIRNPG
jgi:hypothetical protein